MRRTTTFIAAGTIAVAGLIGGGLGGAPSGAQVDTSCDESSNPTNDLIVLPDCVDLTVTKAVTGDDPGVPFAMTVWCRANEAGQPEPPTPTPGDDLVLEAPGDSAAQVIELAGGKSVTLKVDIPSNSESLASISCRVTEDLADTTLPEGYSCATPTIVPEIRGDETEPDTDGWASFYDKKAEGEYFDDAATIEVTNSCVKTASAPAEEPASAPAQVVATPTFTG